MARQDPTLPQLRMSPRTVALVIWPAGTQRQIRPKETTLRNQQQHQLLTKQFGVSEVYTLQQFQIQCRCPHCACATSSKLICCVVWLLVDERMDGQSLMLLLGCWYCCSWCRRCCFCCCCLWLILITLTLFEMLSTANCSPATVDLNTAIGLFFIVVAILVRSCCIVGLRVNLQRHQCSM